MAQLRAHERRLTWAQTLGACSLCLGLLVACGGTTSPGSGTAAGSNITGDITSSGSHTTTGSFDTTTGSFDTTTGSFDTTTGSSSGITDCPSVEPPVYSSCSTENQACGYSNCVAPDYRDAHVLQCYAGAWQLAGSEPCTAPNECPPYVRLLDACGYEGWQGSLGPCIVYDACGAHEAYCRDGSWQTDEAAPDGDGGEGGADGVGTVTTGPAPVPQCPPFPLYEGSSCCPSDVPAYCDYSSSGSNGATATQTVVSAVGGFAAGTFGGPFTLLCAECSPNMVWTASNACP